MNPFGQAPQSKGVAGSQWGLLAAIGTFALVFAFCCGSSLGWEQVYAYRDTGLFYFPLFRLVRNEWLAGLWPLWNPWLNAGQPLAGSATPCVFYPLSALMLLPFPFPLLFNTFISLHLVLAAWGSWRLARGQNRSGPAAAMAALTYAFGAPVLFQTCNVIVLIGAAWLPWAIHWGLRLFDQPARKPALLLALFLTLSILGGDPQSAYHALLILGLVACAESWPACRQWLSSRRLRSQQSPDVANTQPTFPIPLTVGSGALASDTSVPPAASAGAIWLWLTAAASLAAALSMIQIAPTAELVGLSSRSYEVSPLSLWKVPTFLSGQSTTLVADGQPAPHWSDGFIGNPAPPAKQYVSIYGLSCEPYAFIEFFWPQFFGQSFPNLIRWLPAIGLGRPAFWTPSIYCGFIPFVLALAASVRRSPIDRTRFWTWLTILSFVASWGAFGGGIVVRWIGELATRQQIDFARHFGDEVGGLYWLLVTCLPAYDGFRFPAKWLGVTTLGLAQLAAIGLDQLPGGSSTKITLRVLKSILLVLGIGVLIAYGVGLAHGLPPLLTASSSSAATATWTAVLSGGLLGIIIGLLAWYLISRTTNAVSSETRSWPSTPFLLLALTAIDLAIVQRGLVVFAPVRDVFSGNQLVDQLRADQQSRPVASASPFPRIYRTNDWPIQTSDHRLIQRRDFETLCENTPYLYETAAAAKQDTFQLHDYISFFDPMPIPGRSEYIAPRRSHDLWSTEYFVTPAQPLYQVVDGTALGLERSWDAADHGPAAQLPMPTGPLLPAINLTSLAGTDLAHSFRLIRNDSALPRARVVHAVSVIPAIEKRDINRWLGIMQTLAYPSPGTPPLHNWAIVEDNDLHQTKGEKLGQWDNFDPPPETCLIRRDEPSHVEIEVDLQSPGLVILADVYYPGWQLTVSSNGEQPVETRILRVNRAQRGCWLPAGKHLLTYSYNPASVRWGATISTAAIILWLTCWFCPTWLALIIQRAKRH